MTEHPQDPLILVDAHVHVYDCYDVANLLDAAQRNFSIEARRHGANGQFQGILLLAETSRDHWYRHIAESRQTQAFGSWRIAPKAPGTHSLRAQQETGQSIVIVPGRQVVTSEGLEVLALCTDHTFDDGGTVDEILRKVRANGALPVLPWGVGKWLGRRGAIVTRILRKFSDGPLFLGDNSGRPTGWPTPVQFKYATEDGIRILPGSDPLPLPQEISRVGSFGFGMHATLGSEPTAGLKKYLQRRSSPIFRYGNLERPMRFLRNQLSIRKVGGSPPTRSN